MNILLNVLMNALCLIDKEPLYQEVRINFTFQIQIIKIKFIFPNKRIHVFHIYLFSCIFMYTVDSP